MKKLIVLIVLVVNSIAIFAQTTKEAKHKMEDSTTPRAIYFCPMHPDVTSNKPGKCPKCGMDLTLSKKEQMKMDVMKIYACPMHPEIIAKKPGKCPKCGMTLVEKKVEKNNAKMKM